MSENIGTGINLLSKGKIILIKIVVFLVAIVVIAAIMFFNGYKIATEKSEKTIKELEEEKEKLSDPAAQYEIASREISIELIKSQIQDIGEIATIEYLYTDAGKFEDPAKMFGKEIPFSFTTKSFIVKWDGVIKAGVKVDEITVEVNDSNKEIVVYIPKAEILSHEIDSESIETLDEKNGLFNSIKVEDIREFDAISKEEMEQRAIENGLLDKAFENAKEIIYKFVDTGLVKELGYTITFKVIE
ncbi:MAG: DUF4230 domain-containing protein [Lachnospiraceae bacterium]|nr:DUF4230 domain-containing protein [Lachnospiraceae bacterium]